VFEVAELDSRIRETLPQEGSLQLDDERIDPLLEVFGLGKQVESYEVVQLDRVAPIVVHDLYQLLYHLLGQELGDVGDRSHELAELDFAASVQVYRIYYFFCVFTSAFLQFELFIGGFVFLVVFAWLYDRQELHYFILGNRSIVVFVDNYK